MLCKKIACAELHDLLENISKLHSEEPLFANVYHPYKETSKRIETIIHSCITSNIQFQKQNATKNTIKRAFDHIVHIICILNVMESLCLLVGFNPIYSGMSQLGINKLLQPKSSVISSRILEQYKSVCRQSFSSLHYDLNLMKLSCESQLGYIMTFPGFQEKCVQGITTLQTRPDPFSKELDWIDIFSTESTSCSKNGDTCKKNLAELMTYIDQFKEQCNPEAYLSCKALPPISHANHFYSIKSILTLDFSLKYLALWLGITRAHKYILMFSFFIRSIIPLGSPVFNFVKDFFSEDVFFLSHSIKHCKNSSLSHHPYHPQKVSDYFNEILVSSLLSFLYSFLLILNMMSNKLYTKNTQEQLIAFQNQIKTEMTTFLEKVNDKDIEALKLFLQNSTEIKEKVLCFFEKPQSSYHLIKAFIKEEYCLLTTKNPHSKSPFLKFLSFFQEEENLENITNALKSPLSYSIPWFPMFLQEPGNPRPFLIDMNEYLLYKRGTGLSLSGSKQKGPFPYFLPRDHSEFLYLIFLFKISELCSDA